MKNDELLSSSALESYTTWYAGTTHARVCTLPNEKSLNFVPKA